VTITGTNFVSGATVTIGGTLAQDVSVVNSTSLTATTPSGTAGSASVVVTNPDNQVSNSDVTYTYVAPASAPTVSGINPASGKKGDVETVTISGSGFQDGCVVTFENGSGPAPVASVNSVSDTSMDVTVTIKAGGPKSGSVWDVRVTNPDGSSGVKHAAFTVS
jgi:hypothetical protein